MKKANNVVLWPLRRKLVLFLLIIFLPGFGAIVIKGLKQREARILEARNNAFLLTESLAAQQEQLVATTKTMLTMLAEMREVQNLDSKACSRIFADLQSHYPFFSVILAATADGNVFAGSRPFEPTNVADRKYMKDVIRKLDFVAGEYTVDRIGGEVSLHFAYPVLSADKHLIAVVVAGFDPKTYQRFLSKLNLPDGYAVLITDWKGLRLFRSPGSTYTPVGQPISSLGWTLIGGQEQGFREWKSLDGTDRIYGFRQMRLPESLDPYLYMLVGIPKQHIIHAADLQMLGDLLLLGGAAAATMALVWILGNIVLVKPLASLVSATERFGAGEMKARTDLPYTADELGKLAKSFDEMAALLEKRNTERENAEEALQKTNSELQQHREQLEHEVARRTAELRQSEERYRRIVDTAQEGIAVLDSEGRVTYANRRMAEMLGYAPEELFGHPVLDFAPESMREQKTQHLLRRKQRIREQYEFCFRRKDGSELWAMISASPLVDGEGNFIGSLGLITDVTEAKRSQVELSRLNRALATLSKCDEALIHATDEPSLLTKICEIVIRTGGYRMAWVTFPGGKPDDPILPAAKAGFEAGYLEKIHLTWADAEHGLGVIGAAMRTRQPCVVHDIANNPQITRWREEAIRNGYGSYIALPLLQGSSAMGVLSIYASETDAFDEKEVALLKELAGNLAYGIRSLRNEVERRRAEAAVRESEQRYRMLFERNPQSMWIFDLETLRFLEVNDAAISHYGYSREEFLQMTIGDIRSPEDVPEVLANVGKRDDGYDFTGTFRHRKKDGSIILAEVSRYAFVQNGRRVRLILSSDVTERKRAEDELRASEQRYRALFENNLAAVFRVSEPGKLLDCNEAACQMLGYSREELLALDLRTLYCDLAVREAGKKLLYASGKLSNYKVDLRRKDGTVVSVLTNLTLLHEEAGKAPVIAGIMLDVTEVGKLQEQLLQSQKLEAIGKLTGGIAHDFNNILMIINSYSEIVLDKVEAQSPLRRPLEQIRTAADRAASLTRQLLAFSRKQVMTPVVLNLAGVLSDLKEMLKRLIGEDIALEIAAPESLWLTKADVSQVQQVIFNLAVNARDAMPNGGKLVLRAANAELGEDFVEAHPWGNVGQYVVLAVSDTGFGMSPEIQSRIFEPFFTTKEPGQGTGLGLSTVYGIVKQSGGYITVESEPGGGTTFYIYLPRVMAGRAPRSEEQAEVAGTLRATILLVEDEDATREAITDYLEQNGFQVVGVASAEEALRTCEGLPAGRIDVLLTDVVMPGMSGIDLASKLRSQLSEIKVIFISGYTDDVLVRSGINPSQITLLSKPFRLSDLVSKLQEVLTSSQPV